jgi:hypothetical protein
LGHVVSLSEEVARPSLGLIDAIEQLARELHPEVFPAQNEIRSPIQELHERFPALASTAEGSKQCAR